MGYQILKQPDAKFAIFSSFTDAIIVWNASQDEIVEWFADRAAERSREETRRVLTHVTADDPRKVYAQFAMTWEDALETDRERGGRAWRELGVEPKP